MRLCTVITGQTKPAADSLATASTTPGINVISSSRLGFNGSTSVPAKSKNTPRRPTSTLSSTANPGVGDATECSGLLRWLSDLGPVRGRGGGSSFRKRHISATNGNRRARSGVSQRHPASTCGREGQGSPGLDLVSEHTQERASMKQACVAAEVKADP